MIKYKINNTQKIILVVLSLVFITAITLMIYDYAVRPPKDPNNSIYKITGNIEGSLYWYIPLTIVEYICGAVIFIISGRIKIFLRITICFALLILTLISHALTMEAGGVEATHALWFTFLFIAVIITFIIVPKGKTNRK